MELYKSIKRLRGEFMASKTSVDCIGSITKLSTEEMTEAVKELRDNVKEFQNCRNKIESITSELLSTWIGNARNSYEVEYNLLKRNLKDIEDDLYDLYDGIVESIAAYMETDEKIAKNIEGNS